MILITLPKDDWKKAINTHLHLRLVLQEMFTTIFYLSDKKIIRRFNYRYMYEHFVFVCVNIKLEIICVYPEKEAALCAPPGPSTFRDVPKERQTYCCLGKLHTGILYSSGKDQGPPLPHSCKNTIFTALETSRAAIKNMLIHMPPALLQST